MSTPDIAATITLTPTEDLIIEVLVARHRLEEGLWTFEARHKRSIESLAAKGLVTPMHPIVQGTVRARLSDLGREAFIDPTYVPEVFRTECREWYSGPHTGGFRVDCDRRRHHKGKHRVDLAGMRIEWTTAEGAESREATAARIRGLAEGPR